MSHQNTFKKFTFIEKWCNLMTLSFAAAAVMRYKSSKWHFIQNIFKARCVLVMKLLSTVMECLRLLT